MSRTRREALYWVGAALLLGLYAVVAAVLIAGKDWTDEGPLSRNAPALKAPLEGGVSIEAVRDTCFPGRDDDAVTKVVGGAVDGELYYACYSISGYHEGNSDAYVLDLRGRRVGDSGVIKRGGAWPWIGTSSGDLGIAGLFSLGMLALLWIWHRLRRPAPGPRKHPRWRKAALIVLGIVLGVAGLYVFAATALVLEHPDPWGLATVAVMGLALLWGIAAGASLVMGRLLFPSLQLEAQLKELAAGLLALAVALPILVAVFTFLAALGGQFISRTGWHSLVVVVTIAVLAVGAAGTARWVDARRRLAAGDRPSAIGAIAVCAVSLVAIIAVAVPVYGLFDWFGLEIDSGAAETATTEPEAGDTSGYGPRERLVSLAASVAHPDDLVDVSCGHPDSTGDSACTVVLEGFVCQRWVVTHGTNGRLRAEAFGEAVKYTRVSFDVQSGETTCS